MLIGLDPLLSPDLLHDPAAMGHGDRIVLVDANYPATRGRRLISLPAAIMQVVGEADAVPPEAA